MKYYRVDFELKEEAKHTQDADEFIPTIVCVPQELEEILDRQEELSATITNIRPATDDEVLNCVHYYI